MLSILWRGFRAQPVLIAAEGGASEIELRVSLSCHFMTMMLAAVLAWNPLLLYNPGFQLSVAAVFGILLLRKPLLSLVKSTVLRPLKEPPELLSNLLAVSLAAQIATAPIVATSFDEVSVIGVLTNLVAVSLSGAILTLGLLVW